MSCFHPLFHLPCTVVIIITPLYLEQLNYLPPKLFRVGFHNTKRLTRSLNDWINFEIFTAISRNHCIRVVSECVYSVSVSASAVRAKVSLGTNPWNQATADQNLASLAEKYGGGGHQRVSAISFE